MAADGVDLVDEDDARGVRLALLEQVAHPRGADADEHLDEIGAADAEKGYSGFSRDRPGEVGLSRSRRSYEQHPLRSPPPEALEFHRILEELDDLLELLLGFVRPGDVAERRLALVLHQQLGPALPEREQAPRTALHLPQDEDPESDEEQPWEKADQHGVPLKRLFLEVEVDSGFLPLLPGFGIDRSQVDDEALSVGEGPVKLIVADDLRLDYRPARQVFPVLHVGDLGWIRGHAAEELGGEYQDENEEYPEGAASHRPPPGRARALAVAAVRRWLLAVCVPAVLRLAATAVAFLVTHFPDSSCRWA